MRCCLVLDTRWLSPVFWGHPHSCACFVVIIRLSEMRTLGNCPVSSPLSIPSISAHSWVQPVWESACVDTGCLPLG